MCAATAAASDLSKSGPLDACARSLPLLTLSPIKSSAAETPSRGGSSQSLRRASISSCDLELEGWPVPRHPKHCCNRRWENRRAGSQVLRHWRSPQAQAAEPLPPGAPVAPATVLPASWLQALKGAARPGLGPQPAEPHLAPASRESRALRRLASCSPASPRLRRRRRHAEHEAPEVRGRGAPKCAA